MTDKMKAIGYKKSLPLENQDSLFEFQTEIPSPESHDLLVKIEAISVNPVDVFTRQSQTKELSDPKIIGYDAVGQVVKVGEETSLFNVGDKVFYAGSYARSGSDSEYQVVDERIVGHEPKKLSDAQSAAMPLTSITAWEALFEQMAINIEDKLENSKKSILVINGGGGVGSVATQLSSIAGLNVITTAGNAKTSEWEKQNGSDFVVDYHHNLVDQIHKLGFKYVDYILELKDLDFYWDTIIQLIGPEGNIVSTTGTGKSLDFSSLKHRMVRFSWEWMYTKSWYHTPDMISQHEILEKISQLLDSGKLKSTLTKTFTPITSQNLRKATKLVETNHMLGKVVLQK